MVQKIQSKLGSKGLFEAYYIVWDIAWIPNLQCLYLEAPFSPS